MSKEEEYIECIEKLEQCLHDIKIISTEIGDLISTNARVAILEIDQGVAKLERELEVSIKEVNDVQ